MSPRSIALLAAGLLLPACGAEQAQETDGPEAVGVAVAAETVNQAANDSCSTLSVKGLSEQIVAQSNCLSPGAFVKVPARPNLDLAATVFPYLEEPARDALVAALDANPGTSMQVNSMLRTVAQQFLLYYWYQTGQCGIGLAATPGGSNHETGLALDVQQYSAWKGPLGNHGFAWFGSADTVHFDYVGAGSVDYKGTDVLAFQKLWNKNHPGDLIGEDGDYGPQTESRLKQAPAGGFADGPSCDEPKAGADIRPSIRITDADDRFTDGSSAGAADLFEGETYTVELELSNKGDAKVADVQVGVWLEEPYLIAGDYLIESDYGHAGTFAENDANTAAGNPPQDSDPGQTFTLKMNGMSPGETKRITLAVAAGAYSIGLGEPEVRFWVKDLPELYHQDEFDGDATNVDGSQTFNGGKLQVALPTDVYSRTRWEWDSDRLEGWTASAGAALSADAEAKALTLGGEGDDPGAVGPVTSFPAGAVSGVSLRMKRTGGSGDARLYFTTEDDPVMDEDKSLPFEIADDSAFHELTLDVSANPRWSGTITALRIDPFTAGPGSAELDYLRAGEPTGAGEGGAGAAAGDPAAAPMESCSCRVTGGYPAEAPWPLLGLGLALAAWARLATRKTATSRRWRSPPC